MITDEVSNENQDSKDKQNIQTETSDTSSIDKDPVTENEETLSDEKPI